MNINFVYGKSNTQFNVKIFKHDFLKIHAMLCRKVLDTTDGAGMSKGNKC